MLAVWGHIEADFQRDYGFDLEEELPRMSWRKFCVLLDGLSPYGALATHYQTALKEQREEEERESRVPSQAVDRFWSRITSLKPANTE